MRVPDQLGKRYASKSATVLLVGKERKGNYPVVHRVTNWRNHDLWVAQRAEFNE